MPQDAPHTQRQTRGNPKSLHSRHMQPVPELQDARELFEPSVTWTNSDSRNHVTLSLLHPALAFRVSVSFSEFVLRWPARLGWD